MCFSNANDDQMSVLIYRKLSSVRMQSVPEADISCNPQHSNSQSWRGRFRPSIIERQETTTTDFLWYSILAVSHQNAATVSHWCTAAICYGMLWQLTWFQLGAHGFPEQTIRSHIQHKGSSTKIWCSYGSSRNPDIQAPNAHCTFPLTDVAFDLSLHEQPMSLIQPLFFP